MTGVTPLNVTLGVAFLLALTTQATWIANRWGHCPTRVVNAFGFCTAASGLLVCALVVMGERSTIDWDRLTPSGETVFAVGFYAGVLLLAVLGLLVMTAPFWRDRDETNEAADLAREKTKSLTSTDPKEQHHAS